MITIHTDIIEMIKDAIVIADKQGLITYSNASFKSLVKDASCFNDVVGKETMVIVDNHNFYEGFIFSPLLQFAIWARIEKINDGYQALIFHDSLDKTHLFDEFFSENLDLMCIASLEGVLLRLNKEWSRVLGYSLAEMIDRSAMDFIHPDDIEATIEVFSALKNNEKVLNFKNRYRCKDGSYRYIEWRSIRSKNSVFGAARDVTDWVNQQDKLKLLLDTSFLFLNSETNQTLDLLPNFLSISGFKHAAFYTISNDKVTLISSTNDELSAFNHIDDIDLTKSYQRYGIELCSSTPYKEVVVFNIQQDNVLLAVFVVGLLPDETFVYSDYLKLFVSQCSVALQRQYSSMLLLNSEKNYRTLINKMNQGLVLYKRVNNDYKYVSYNKKFLEMMNVSTLKENMTIRQVLPNDYSFWTSRYDKIQQSGDERLFEFQEHGNYYKCHAYWAKKDHVALMVSDITEKVRSEKILSDSQLRLELAVETSGAAIWQYDKTTNKINFSERWSDILGYSASELCINGTDCIDYLHPDEVVQFYKSIENIIQDTDGDTVSLLNRALHSDGSYRWIMSSGKKLEDENGVRWIGSSIDVTHVKEAEEKLRQSELSKKVLLNTIPIQMWYLTSVTSYGEVNEAHAKYNGHTIENMSYQKMEAVLPKETTDRCIITNRLAFTTGKALVVEQWLKDNHGNANLFKITKTPKLRADGSVEYLVCTAEDITAQRTMEDELKISEQNKRILLNNVPIQMWYLTNYRTYGEVNKAHAEYFGIPLETMQFADMSTFVAEEWMLEATRTNKQAFDSGKVVISDEWTIDKHGHDRLLHLIKTPILGDDGSVEYVVCTAEDITEKVEMEQNLRESENSKKILLNNVPTQMWYLVDEMTYGEVNETHANYNGMTAEQMSNKPLFDLFPKEIAEICKISNFAAFSSRRQMVVEEWLPDYQGYKRLFKIVKTPKFREDGSVEYLVCTAEDITNQRAMENELKFSEKNKRTLLNNVPIQMWYLTNYHTYGEVNQCHADYFGYDIAHMEHRDMNDFLPPELAENCYVTNRKVFEEGKTIETEEWAMNIHGENRLLHLIKTPIKDMYGTVEYVVCTAEDITDRKIMEMENEKQRLVIERSYKQQEVMLQISSKFNRCNEENFDNIVEESFSLLSEIVHCDRIYVFKHDFICQTTTNIYEWCNEGITPEIDNLQNRPIEEMDSWMESHRVAKAVFIENVHELPSNEPIKEVLLAQGIISMITVPLFIGETLFGFAGFDSVNKSYLYKYDDEIILTEFSRELMNTISRLDVLSKLRISEGRFRKLFQEVDSVAVVGYNCNREVIYWNKASEKMYGYRSHEILGKKLFDDLFYQQQDYERAVQYFDEAFEQEDRRHQIEMLHYHKNGSSIPVLTSKTILELDDHCKEMYSVDVDLSKQKHLERTLQLERELLHKTLMSIGDGVISTDIDGKINVINEVAQQLTGYSFKEALGLNVDMVFNIVDELSREKYIDIYRKITKETTSGENTVLLSKNGNEYMIEYSISPIEDAMNAICGVVITFRDSTDRKNKQRQIEYLSYNDYLTGLYNRRYIEESLNYYNYTEHLPLLIMYLDVNGLKLVNDTFGHNLGDDLLVSVSSILREVSDKGCILGRIGGDEFILIKPNASLDDGERLKQAILKRCDEVNSDKIVISVAIGYGYKMNLHQELKVVQSDAENLMYQDKAQHGLAMRQKMLKNINKTVEKRFPHYKSHCELVAKYSERLAIALQLNDEMIDSVRHAALYHGVGKIVIEPSIINKSEKLSCNEMDIVKKHSEVGYQILKLIDEHAPIAKIVLYHHERYDGQGYPHGLKGDEIPLLSRILSIADSFESMRRNRSYAQTLSIEQAFEELRRCSFTQFDGDLVEVFIKEMSKDN